jgi:hypothetical protein
LKPKGNAFSTRAGPDPLSIKTKQTKIFKIRNEKNKKY